MSIQVNNFNWVKGENDAEYIKLLCDALERDKKIISKAIAKIRELSARPEVIRCKDCKWFGDIGCAISIVDDSDKPKENDFCSFAERRGDKDN